jgi:UDP:flavonoid glycosyltransferase YjiC (YdhE family)
MKITLLTGGTQGDVRPMLVVGARLKARGHSVTLCTFRCHRALVERSKLAFAQMAGDPEAWLGAQATALHEAGKHDELNAFLAKHYAEACRDALAACDGARLIVVTATMAARAYTISEKLQIPLVGVFPVPTEPTGAFPCVLLPRNLRVPLLNRLTYSLFRYIFWAEEAERYNWWRQRLQVRRCAVCLFYFIPKGLACRF